MPAAIPWIALAVSAAGTGAQAYGSYKANKTAKETAASAQGVAQDQLGLSRQMFATGSPMLQQAGNYWQTLLGGSRGAMAQATAGPRAAITGIYRGATRGLERSGLQGGARDTAFADLNRERASRIASLTTGQQGNAAANLSEIGGKYLGVGSGLSSNAGGLFTSLAGLATNQANQASQSAGESAAGTGRLLFDLLKSYQTGKTQSYLPSSINAGAYATGLGN